MKLLGLIFMVLLLLMWFDGTLLLLLYFIAQRLNQLNLPAQCTLCSQSSTLIQFAWFEVFQQAFWWLKITNQLQVCCIELFGNHIIFQNKQIVLNSKMGCSLGNPDRHLASPGKHYITSSKKIQEQDYDLDVIEMYNLAIAMRHKQPTLNIQIGLSCENLREDDIFGYVNPMIICFKTQVDGTNNSTFVQIGRTQVIPNQTNPRFIKSFVLSYNQQKTQDIQFHVYDIDKNRTQLDKQPLIGIVQTNMREIVEAGTLIRQIGERSYHKSKGQLKIFSSEYDSGNTKFQIQLSANNFMNKHELLLKMEIFKRTEWVPIHKTQSKNNHRQIKFQSFEISTNKFPDEDRGRFRIKVFESSDSKTEVQVGSTQQIYIQDLQKNQKHYIKVYKDAFIIGHISINKFEKVVRDSFISYIINGAHLHLLAAVDFSSSTQAQHTIKQDENTGKATNQYIQAINQVIGVLQYFDYYNQIPMYGFGAKLPPYYKTVSQCFALSGNYYEPIIGGGVDQLIKVYNKALKKIKYHGPSKLLQIIELACEYAQADPQSSDYYILIIFTDGTIDDKEQVTKQIMSASGLALSILFVGLGDVDQQFLGGLTKINEKDEKNEKEQRENKEMIKRNIVQFIPFRNFANDSSHKIIKEIFSKIPKQFIQYMKFRKIKPNTNKKQLLNNIINKESKIAKAQYINFRINENKKLQLDRGNYVVYKPNFLGFKKRQLMKQLQEAGFPASKLLEDMNICMNDINYYIEMDSYAKQSIAASQPPESVLVYIKQTNKLDELTQKKKIEVQKRTLLKLQNAQNNQYGIKIRKKEVKMVEKQEQFQVPDNPCIHCGKFQIDLMYVSCGHICCCHRCEKMYCQICKQKNTGSIILEIKKSM